MEKIINKTSLTDDICEYLRSSIFTFQFKPGDQINESKLIKELGISRSPIREAIRVLEGEGLIERIARKGVFVKKITLKEVKNIFSIRAVLEALAAEQAAPNFTDKDLLYLERIFTKMKQAVSKINYKSYMKLNFEFHQSFRRIADNRNLEKLIENLGRQSSGFLFTTVSLSDSLDASLNEHKKILDAFFKKDPNLAAKMVKEHVTKGGKRAQKFFK